MAAGSLRLFVPRATSYGSSSFLSFLLFGLDCKHNERVNFLDQFLICLVSLCECLHYDSLAKVRASEAVQLVKFLPAPPGAA